jgi:hypothetical protein
MYWVFSFSDTPGLVAIQVKVRRSPMNAVITTPEGVPYEVSGGNNFGQGKDTIIIPKTCTDDNMFILFDALTDDFYCRLINSSANMVCISNSTDHPDIGERHKNN